MTEDVNLELQDIVKLVPMHSPSVRWNYKLKSVQHLSRSLLDNIVTALVEISTTQGVAVGSIQKDVLRSTT